jgi:hypothetical protein
MKITQTPYEVVANQKVPAQLYKLLIDLTLQGDSEALSLLLQLYGSDIKSDTMINVVLSLYTQKNLSAIDLFKNCQGLVIKNKETSLNLLYISGLALDFLEKKGLVK